MFEIDITSFGDGTHRVKREPEAEDFELDPEVFDDIEVDAVLHCRARRILVMLQARATATLTCDRTLRPFEQPLEGSYSVLFAARPANVPDESDEHEEVRELHPADRALDLTDVVRETLLLAVPQRQVAPGAEEEDLQTTFGAPVEENQEPIDPRWEKLRELRSNEGE